MISSAADTQGHSDKVLTTTAKNIRRLTRWGGASMATSRREFLKSSALVGSALGTAGTPNLAGSHDDQAGVIPTRKSMELNKLLNMKFPIVQAPHAGAGPDLVAAVSNAGGMGILGGLNRLTPESVFEYVTAARKLTTRVFAVNYLLGLDTRSLPFALEAGAPVVHFSWGLPTKEMVSLVRKAGSKFGVQVANAAGARASLQLLLTSSRLPRNDCRYGAIRWTGGR